MLNRVFSALSRAVLVSAIVTASPFAVAQDYPSRPIKLVIPYTPGGSIDTIGRMVADHLQRQLGQSIVIENQGGAAGLLGSLTVKKAKPDGYTLLFNASSQVYLPLIVSTATYDAEKDFTPIAQIGNVPLIVAVNNDVPARNLKELAALAHANPGKYTWATSGLATSSNLCEEMLNRALQLNMEIIPYKGAVPQLTDVVGGHVSAAISPMPGVNPFVQAGRLRAIAVTGKARVASLPDVPTVSESAVPGFELESWYGLWGPADLPPAIVERLNAEVAKALASPAIRQRFAELSFVPTNASPEAFTKIIRDDIDKIGKVIKDAKIKVEL